MKNFIKNNSNTKTEEDSIVTETTKTIKKNTNNQKSNKNSIYIKNLFKKFGKNVFQDEKMLKEMRFSSGSLTINDLLGGGYPFKKIIEIFGQPSTGKTTLGIHAIKEMQEEDPRKTAFFDIEKSLNIEYMKKIGVDCERNLILRPQNAEQTFDLIVELLKTERFSLIVIDSVAALLPEEEKKKEMTESTIGLQARIMSKALRKINYLLSDFNASIIFINQIREKVKIMFGNPEITSGGNALKFYSSIRIELRNKGKIIEKDEGVGQITKIRIVKNKISSPFKRGEIKIYYGSGINKIEEIIEKSLEKQILEKKGNWFWYNGVRIALGLKGIRKKFEEDSNFSNEIKKNLFF